jgi:segregation and condensation protein A
MYTVRLPNFEGPLELLLYFVKRDELDIYDIPIAHITEEFLGYVRLMQALDLELAGEFLVMAATLLRIKAQMLLPRPPREDGSPAEDPRTELVVQLVEYSRVRDLAEHLAQRAEAQRYVYYRTFLAEQPSSSVVEYRNATLFDLLGALYSVLARREQEPQIVHQLKREQYSVEEQATVVLDALRQSPVLRFTALVQGRSRAYVVATFLALLELCRSGAVLLRQDDTSPDIVIEQREPVEQSHEPVTL